MPLVGSHILKLKEYWRRMAVVSGLAPNALTGEKRADEGGLTAGSSKSMSNGGNTVQDELTMGAVLNIMAHAQRAGAEDDDTVHKVAARQNEVGKNV